MGTVHGCYAGPGGQRRWLGGGGLPRTVTGMDEHYQEGGDRALRSTSRPDGGGGADEGERGGLVPGSVRRKSGEGVPREDSASRQTMIRGEWSRSRELCRGWLAAEGSFRGTIWAEATSQRWRRGRGGRQRQQVQTILSRGWAVKGIRDRPACRGKERCCAWLRTRETRCCINAD